MILNHPFHVKTRNLNRTHSLQVVGKNPTALSQGMKLLTRVIFAAFFALAVLRLCQARNLPPEGQLDDNIVFEQNVVFVH